MGVGLFMIDIRNYSLLNNNTFGIDETCRRYIQFDTRDECIEVVRSLTDADRPLLIIGGGSNLLLTGPFEGTVLRSNIKGIEQFPHLKDDNLIFVRAGSGETWDDVVEYCVSNGLYGAENLSIIPGDVGASAVQNIGAYGCEAKDLIYFVETIEIATGEIKLFMKDELEYGYRHSRFKTDLKGKYIITYVDYLFSKTFTLHADYGNIRTEIEKRGIANPTARDIRNIIIDIRNAKLPDPKVEGNAGSFFMNPVIPRSQFEALQEQYPQMPHYYVDADSEKVPAGWLIDQCGWKGKTLGKAGVHDKQALVLVNRGGAKGSDIVALCDTIRKDVKEKFGIEIKPEVNFIP